MARRSTKENVPDDFEEHILDTDIKHEMETSFLEYAYSVIYSRALPDARDGLKPVQRRILYTMNDMGLRPDRGHVKSARVVGEVMGRLHPHGAGAIYDAMVRMAQPWSMRLPFVDGHGNFGSPDDSPAAMRYTEARMAPAAVAMTASIDEDTVDFKLNYDGRELEPAVLPSAIPNLVVIEVKNGFVPEALLEQLYKLTPMEDSFGINAVALVDGQPRTLALKEMLEVFLGHRFDVVRRRSLFRRKKAADRLHLVEGLLLAIIDIDEVIQLIRTSDNAAAAKERLMTVFELSEVQADYILDMPLRRLTRFSKLELDKEQSELQRTIEELDAILGDDKLLRKVVSDELAEVAKTYGTPRRTVLLESAGTTVTAAAVPLEVADDPCFVYLSSSGLLARSANAEQPGSGGGRANHDVVVSIVRATTRGEIGGLTSTGRLVKLGVLELPQLPGTANDPHLAGGLPVSEFLALGNGERLLALCSLTTDGPGLALGTRQGIVKRVNPEVLGRDEWEVISLKDGDEVVGAVELASGEEELCFITTDAQLLHFPASGVRPQGRSGGGMAGIKLSAGQRAAFFGAFDPADAVVVTASGSSTALPGTEAGAVKVTPFTEYPGKGRATGGVRSHRFLKGEDTLVAAWAGPGPARAAADSGAPIDLPEATGKRDGSGTPAAQPIAAVASPVAHQVAGRAAGSADSAPAPVEG